MLNYNKGNDVFYVVRAEMLEAGQFEATKQLLVGLASSSVE
jgi:hypothetical protein